MSKFTNLNKTALLDLVAEIPKEYLESRGIVLTDTTTNKELISILEGREAENPTNPEGNTQNNTASDVVRVPVKTVEKATLEEGQVFAGVTVYGDQEGISEELAKYPKVRVLIPLMEGEPKGSTQFIGLNGAKYHVTKGKMVELPLPLAEIIDNSFKIDLGDVESLELTSVPKELQ